MMLFLYVLQVTLLIANLNAFGLAQNSTDKLIGVVVLHRHGDRAPISTYSDSDPYYDPKYWPNGYGQLLDKGKTRLFNLGKWLRARYDGFLSKKYSREEILIRSTDVDRTLMSVAANLAGLYFVENQQENWEPTLAWDPIPIHTVPQADDAILAMEKSCPNFDTLYHQVLNSEYYQSLLQQHTEIQDILEKYTGRVVKHITFYRGIYSVFYVYSQHNASYLPSWASEINMEELSNLAGEAFAVSTHTEELQRYLTGQFFYYLQNYLDGIVDGTNQKFLILSAHDSTVSTILNSYQAYDYHPPDFGDTIIWELYQTSENMVQLKLFRRTQSEILQELSIRNCSSPCSFEEYVELLKPITVDPETWSIECTATK